MPLQSLLSALTPDQRKARLDAVHPLVSLMSDVWQVLLDAYEGLGGYVDGNYLWRFPAELESDFRERQRQARYHNYARQIVNMYVRYALGKDVDRQAETETGKRYLAWAANVDGAGTSLTDFLRVQARLALAQGQQGLLVDRTTEAPTGASVADQRARVVLRRFGMGAIRDWRHDARGELLSLKLTEAVDQPNVLAEPLSDDDAYRYLLWDREAWLRLTAEGDADGPSGQMAEQTHGLGFVPFVMLRPEPSATEPMLGQSILGHPNLLRAIYNRGAEEDAVLRQQAFSTLTVEVNDATAVNDTKDQIGTDIGTARALVVAGRIKYETPDMGAPTALRENQQFLVQELMRTAHIRFQRDSLASETAEAIRLQHDELNEMLSGLAREFERVERQIARCWFGWESSGQDADAALADAQLTIKYPREFFVKDLKAELDALAQAISVDFGGTYTKEAKKANARMLSGAGLGPTLTDEQWATVDGEIDGQTQSEGAAGSQIDALRQGSLARLSAAFGDAGTATGTSPVTGV